MIHPAGLQAFAGLRLIAEPRVGDGLLEEPYVLQYCVSLDGGSTG